MNSCIGVILEMVRFSLIHVDHEIRHPGAALCCVLMRKVLLPLRGPKSRPAQDGAAQAGQNFVPTFFKLREDEGSTRANEVP